MIAEAPVPAVMPVAVGAPAPADAATSVARPMMGGTVSVHIVGWDDRPATEAAGRVLDRIDAWAGRLSRFRADSDLSRLNADPSDIVSVGATLTAVLDWARIAEGISDGLVDVAMLDARLAAETGAPVARPQSAARRWSLARHSRGAAVRREPGVRFDLDGVAKGWLADRALAITPGRSALVDGDGDLAVRVAGDDEFLVAVADPRPAGGDLAVVRLAGVGRTRHWGLATSGTSVHRWSHGTDAAHHLIDPATWRPAATDVVQATVLADTAREAEVFAKVAVVAGIERATVLLDRPGVHGVLMLTTRGEIRATPEMLQWLA